MQYRFDDKGNGKVFLCLSRKSINNNLLKLIRDDGIPRTYVGHIEVLLAFDGYDIFLVCFEMIFYYTSRVFRDILRTYRIATYTLHMVGF